MSNSLGKTSFSYIVRSQAATTSSCRFRPIMNPCIVCELTVRPRQQALLCDGCQRWQHHTCNTGVGQDDYREAVRLDQSINWRCYPCGNVEEPPIPILSSTYLHADRESTPLLFSDHSFQSDLSQSMVRIRGLS